MLLRGVQKHFTYSQLKSKTTRLKAIHFPIITIEQPINTALEYTKQQSLIKYVSQQAPPLSVDVEDIPSPQPITLRSISEVSAVILQFLMIFSFTFFIITMMRNNNQSRNIKDIFSKSFETDLNSQNQQTTITFADVAGLDTAKEELQEIVDFLKNPEKYNKMGATIPKGCLLTGAPGLGKTLLAKAIAGEASVPFFSASASEFIELFVGVGASRVRDLFSKAKARAPCIIFIDEIDAIGKSRTNNSGMPTNDEREQTINQLLTEMDGFKTESGIIVIGATNRPDILDNALIRPGRFDRQIALELPGLTAREAILKVHSNNKPLAPTINLRDISKITAGFSGAQLANLMNEAAILAARRNQETITKKDIEDSLERIIIGLEKPDIILSKEKKNIIALHEAGHALVALKIGEYDSIKKVSIIPRGRAGGVTIFDQDVERIESGLYSRQYLENQLAVALGGRVAEEVVLGYLSTTTGASSDLQRVQQIARAMVMNYGFSKRLTNAAWLDRTVHSERTFYIIDQEVTQLANKAYDRAKNIIINNMDLLKKITDQLTEKEVLTGEEVLALVQTIK